MKASGVWKGFGKLVVLGLGVIGAYYFQVIRNAP